MKPIRLIFGTLTVTAALVTQVQAQFNFTTNADNNITITGYTGPGGAVAIPATTNGLPVTSVGNSAFYNSTSITSVSIPLSVTNIGSMAFGYCTSLTAINVDTSNLAFSSLGGVLFDYNQTELIAYPGGLVGSYTIPGSVTNIGDHAFAWCYHLSGITIPSGVTTIGARAFWNCNALLSVTLPASIASIGHGAFAACETLPAFTLSPGNLAYSTVNGVLFDADQTTLVQYPAGATAKGYTIPSGVTDILDDAFDGCSVLTGVNIPRTVHVVRTYAFSSCGLTNLTIPAGVASIGDAAFSSCILLTNVTISSTVTYLGVGAFGNCLKLKGAYFQGNAPADDAAFMTDFSATVYYLPGTTGWGSTFGTRPTALWFLPNPLILGSPSFGVQTNGFGFIVSWATNLSLVVEGCTELANSAWSPIGTNALTDGWFYFGDPNWTNNPACLYRIRSP